MNHMSDHELRVFEKQSVSCVDVTALLGSYVDNDLPVSLRDRIHTHIRSCPECEEGERQYREVISLASELRAKPIPADVQKRLREALNAKLGINLPL